MKASLYQTKQSAKKQLYRTISPLTSHLYHDDDWSGVRSIEAALAEEGCEVTTWCNGTGYRSNREGQQWKEYLMEIQCGSYHFDAILNCHFAGTMENPYAKYDMSFILN